VTDLVYLLEAMLGTTKSAKVSSRGIKPVRKKVKVVEPSRRSSRVAGEVADHIFVTGESGGKGDDTSLAAETPQPEMAPYPSEHRWLAGRHR
jgi:hypothetical protein